MMGWSWTAGTDTAHVAKLASRADSRTLRALILRHSLSVGIVIGNPPYIQLQNNNGELSERYKHCSFQTFKKTGDIYSLFYERGWQLLKENGHLCYITSNKWMRAGYGDKTRAFFTQRANPLLLIDFAGIKIFESATVDTNILLFEK